MGFDVSRKSMDVWFVWYLSRERSRCRFQRMDRPKSNARVSAKEGKKVGLMIWTNVEGNLIKEREKRKRKKKLCVVSLMKGGK